VQGGFGAVFGIQVQIFVRTTRVALCPEERSGCGGKSLIGTTNLSPGKKFVAGTGPASGGAVQAVSEPEICHDAGFMLRASAGIRVQKISSIYLRSRVLQKL
jgi:hypothetical protein